MALSHEVLGAAIEVHKFLGPGLLESVYEAALCRELSLSGIRFVRQQRLPVIYKGESLDCELKLDLMVEGGLIVEVKAVERSYRSTEHNCSRISGCTAYPLGS